jgi:hypothetical protein
MYCAWGKCPICPTLITALIITHTDDSLNCVVQRGVQFYFSARWLLVVDSTWSLSSRSGNMTDKCYNFDLLAWGCILLNRCVASAHLEGGGSQDLSIVILNKL